MKTKILTIVSLLLAIVVLIFLGVRLNDTRNQLSDEKANSNSLQLQLTAAQADAAAQKAAAEEAAAALEAAKTAQADAEKAAEEAAAALEAAQADAAKAAEEAKAALDAALADAEAQKAAAEKAQADADAANAALADAQKTAEDAQKALNDAKAALEAALTNTPAEVTTAEAPETEEAPVEEALVEEVPAEPVSYQLGDEIADFTFTTYDGVEYTLSEVLKEKDMVLINLWATWCGPCQAEFPYMNEAYQEYKDKIEIFALSVEEEDTNEILADYVAQVGMAFPVGRDTVGLNAAFYTGYIPTTVVVDRFGKVCFYEYGSMPDANSFRRLFDVFVGEDYTESVLQEGVPPMIPNVDPTDSAALAVLNAEGGELIFTNPEDEMNWPVVLTTEDDKTCAVTTNVGADAASSLVNVAVAAQEGDALTFDYKVSSELGFDFLAVAFNEDVVKVASGETEWKTAVVPFPAAGEYTVSIGFVKDEASADGQDKAWFGDVKVLTGEDAAAALATLPVYPVSEEITLAPASANAKEIVFDDPTGLLLGSFGDVPYYIIPEEQAEFVATLTADCDPISAVAMASTGEMYVLADVVKDGAYTFAAGFGSSYNYVEFYPNTASPASLMVLYFASEEAVDAFVARNFTDEETGEVVTTWAYADGSAKADAAVEAAEVEYVLTFVDEAGNPVAGVIANVCDDDTCEPMTTDENGQIRFTKAPFAYHIQVLKVPEGYAYDTTAETYLTLEGGETTFTVAVAEAA